MSQLTLFQKPVPLRMCYVKAAPKELLRLEELGIVNKPDVTDESILRVSGCKGINKKTIEVLKIILKQNKRDL